MRPNPSQSTTAPTPEPPPPNTGRTYVGLGLLGWGASILVGAIPHEDRLVAGALMVFGASLLATAPHYPEFRRFAARPLAAFGVALAGTGVAALVAVHGLVRAAPPNAPKVALVVLGLACACAAPFLRHRFTWRQRTFTVASLVVAVAVGAGAPLAMWGLQASAKGVLGVTPTEAFVRVALLPPLALFLPHCAGTPA